MVSSRLLILNFIISYCEFKQYKLTSSPETSEQSNMDDAL